MERGAGFLAIFKSRMIVCHMSQHILHPLPTSTSTATSPGSAIQPPAAPTSYSMQPQQGPHLPTLHLLTARSPATPATKLVNTQAASLIPLPPRALALTASAVNAPRGMPC